MIVWVHLNRRIYVVSRLADSEPHKPGKTYYEIAEVVTSSGLSITWDGLYATIEGAVKEIEIVLEIAARRRAR